MSGRRPITLAEAGARGLLTAPDQGIHTFSNGTEWECWASGNCLACWFWDPDEGGARCALEGAALLGIVSPELAHLFGWKASAHYDQATDVLTTAYPDTCPFFRHSTDDDGNDNPPPPNDPRQLVLIADPTEVIAGVRPAAAPERAGAPGE